MWMPKSLPMLCTKYCYSYNCKEFLLFLCAFEALYLLTLFEHLVWMVVLIVQSVKLRPYKWLGIEVTGVVCSNHTKGSTEHFIVSAENPEITANNFNCTYIKANIFKCTHMYPTCITVTCNFLPCAIVHLI